MDQHRREQAPPLPRRQAVGQWREVDVFADHAELEEGQPAHRFKVVAQHGHRADNQAQQQHQRGGPGVFQLLDEPRALDGLRHRNIQLLIGVTRRKTLVQRTHVFTDVVRHPQHLLASFLADPMGHLHALEQGDEPAQVHRQGQTQYRYSTHCSTSGRSTSTQTNLCGSRRVS
ncbi:hypothetical protein D3C76_247520 [compost metagenome]